MNKHPDDMGPPHETWMALTDDGPEYFDSEDEAREFAEAAIVDYQTDGEYDLAEKVVMARVVAYAEAKIPSGGIDDEDDPDSDEESFEDIEYALVDVLTEAAISQNSKH